MPTCVAPDCTNSDVKGFIMRIFPRDPLRRAQWAANVNRKGWTPHNTSFLCEIHFSQDMWENKRVDGKRKLRINAVPTIFGSEAKKIQSNRENMIHASPNNEQLGCVSEQNVLTQSIQNEQENNDCENEAQLELAKSKKEINELKKMIKRQEQFICQQSRIIQNRNIRVTKLKKCMLNAQRDFKLRKKQINADLLSRLAEMFTDDQIALLMKNKKVQKWSYESIMKALLLRFSCGVTGYQELRRQKFPLPGLRTLHRKLENLKFESRIPDDIYNFLKLKASNWNDINKECCLVFDEISITPGKPFDNSCQDAIGHVTLPEHTGIVSHEMVFMLCGIACRCKQIIDYYFTSTSFNGAVLQLIILDILYRAKSIGLTVNAVTSDIMDAGNQGLWKKLGITAGQCKKCVNYIAHPVDPKRNLYVIADVPHLLKNLKSCILNNNILLLPDNIVRKYNLPTNVVYAKHFEELIVAQQEFQFLLMPKISISDVDTNNNFAKMRVNKAKYLLSLITYQDSK